MFKSLKEFFKPEKPSSTEQGFHLPYKLSNSDYQSLRRLSAMDEWDVYRRTLDEIIKLRGEALLASNDDATIHMHRGFILGLRKAGLLVDEMEFAEQGHLKQERRRNDARSTDEGQRQVATFGSPAWRGRGKR